MSKTLIIRADADSSIGSGHVMRCIALGQAWQRVGGRVVFATFCKNKVILDRLSDEKFTVLELHDSGDFLEHLSSGIDNEPLGSWVVCDGYHFDASYHGSIRAIGYKLLVIDDYNHLPFYDCDILLNQNVMAKSFKYSFAKGCICLMGSQYVLLRSEFLRWRNRMCKIPAQAKSILVTFGGSDLGNVTSRIIKILSCCDLNGWNVTIVTNSKNRGLGVLERQVFGHRNMILIKDPTDMSALMASSDMAITAGGTTCLELAFMGVPMIIAVTAENQFEAAKGLGDLCVGWNLGGADSIDDSDLLKKVSDMRDNTQLRRSMSERQRQFIDGEGASRIVSVICGQEPGFRSQYNLRDVCEDDARLLWCWANDRSVRKVSFDSRPITWDSHLKWLLEKIKDGNSMMLIVQDHCNPVGQIRLNRVSEYDAEISFSISQEYRGRGAGSAALSLVIPIAQDKFGVKLLRGLVVNGNKASEKTFLKSGFNPVYEDSTGCKYSCMVFEREIM